MNIYGLGHRIMTAINQRGMTGWRQNDSKQISCRVWELLRLRIKSRDLSLPHSNNLFPGKVSRIYYVKNQWRGTPAVIWNRSVDRVYYTAITEKVNTAQWIKSNSHSSRRKSKGQQINNQTNIACPPSSQLYNRAWIKIKYAQQSLRLQYTHAYPGPFVLL